MTYLMNIKVEIDEHELHDLIEDTVADYVSDCFCRSGIDTDNCRDEYDRALDIAIGLVGHIMNP